MTEDEAKMKWCPFARHSETGGNRTIYGQPGDEPADPEYCASTAMNFPCIGSECMAWRWALRPNPDYNPSAGAFWPQPHPPTPMYLRDNESGGCGLAGSPQ